MASKPIRNDLYGAMRAAITGNAGYVYRGRDHQPGPQAGLGTLLMLERRGWIRLVRATVVLNTGRRRREVAGGWLLPLGRAALRDEITRRGDDMPDRLALRPARPATPVTAMLARVAAPAAAAAPARTATALLDRPARRAVTTLIDPFALIATGGGRGDDIPF